jgi:hypothetical protein
MNISQNSARDMMIYELGTYSPHGSGLKSLYH